MEIGARQLYILALTRTSAKLEGSLVPGTGLPDLQPIHLPQRNPRRGPTRHHQPKLLNIPRRGSYTSCRLEG